MSRYALTPVIEELVGHPIPERGPNAMILCPLPTHPERDPSFSIHLDKGLWVCHACGERGGINKLAQLLDMEVDQDDLDVRRAMELAQSMGFEEPVDFWDKAVRWQLYEGDPVPKPVRDFAKSKGINKPALYHYRVGWEPEPPYPFTERGGRILFPYWDDGKCVALKYRYVECEGDKKLNKGSETGSRQTILGVDDVRGSRIVFLCEGESDTLALWSYLNRHGMAEGVAVGGVPGVDKRPETWELWALDLLWAEKVFLCFDADEAGDRGFAKAQSVLGDKAIRVRPPESMDMAEYLRDGGKLSSLGVRRRDITD